MKQEAVVNRAYLVLAWALALAACGSDVEIGNSVCSGEGVRCDPGSLEQAEEVGQSDVIAVSPDSLTKLMPVSTVAPLAADELAYYALLTDRAGTLWEFGVQIVDKGAMWPGEGRVRVRTTSLDGNVQEGSVEAPSALRDPHAELSPQPHNSERGPILDLGWFGPCSDPTAGCSNFETLAFGSDAAIPPERTSWPGSLATFSAQAKGRWIFLNSPYTIEQQSHSRKLIWRQTALEKLEYYCNERAEVLESGETVLLATNPYVDKTGADEVWRVGFDGNLKQRLKLLRHVLEPRLVLDTRQRALIAGGDDGGGLRVIRHEGDSKQRSWSFLRTEFTPLAVHAAGADLDDTLYVLTETGGREEKGRTPVLCRVRADDAADCFVLDKPADSMERPMRHMQATGPGIVYVGDGQRLFRYELPHD